METILVHRFKELGFKAHPLAPCVVIMCEEVAGTSDVFTRFICVETDDLLGGGIGPKYQAAIDTLRKTYTFGKWKVLQEQSTEYGGHTLKQFPDYSFHISMTRYLKEKAKEANRRALGAVRAARIAEQRSEDAISALEDVRSQSWREKLKSTSDALARQDPGSSMSISLSSSV